MLSFILYFIDYHKDSYRIKFTFSLLFNKSLLVNPVVSCKAQFFVVMIVSAKNKHTIMQNINSEILIMKAKLH